MIEFPEDLEQKLLACSDEIAVLSELIHYSKSFHFINPQLSIDFGNEILRRAKKINHDEGICFGLSIYGVGAIFIGDTFLGIKTLTELVTFSEAKNFFDHTANAHKYLGNAYKIIGNYTKSLSHYEKSIKIADDHHLKNIRAGALIGVGNLLCSDFQKPEASRPYFFEALECYRELNDQKQEINALNCIASTYTSSFSDFTLALQYFEKSLEISRLVEAPFHSVVSLAGIGEIHRKLGDWNGAESFFTEALGLSDRFPSFKVDIQNFLAKVYRDSKQYNKIQDILLPCYKLAKKLNKIDALKECCLSMAEMYKLLNDEKSEKRYSLEAEAIAEQQFGEKTIQRVKNSLIAFEVKRLLGEKHTPFHETFIKATHKKYENFSSPIGKSLIQKPYAIKTFGRFSVIHSGKEIAFSRKKARDVFKYLLLNYQSSVSTDELIEHIWPTTDLLSGKHLLKNAILQIRNSITPNRSDQTQVIQFRDDAYRLDFQESAEIDFISFKSQVQAARSKAPDQQQEANALLVSALSLYTGEFLKEDRFTEWTSYERELLKDLAISSNAQLAEFYLNNGDTTQAIEAAKRILALDEISDRGYDLLFLIFRKGNQMSEIHKLYQVCKKTFKEQLGIEPPKRFSQYLNG